MFARLLPLWLIALTFLGLLFWNSAAVAQAPPFDLAVRTGTPVITGPGSNGETIVHDLAVDAAGNSYVTGRLDGTVNFGPVTLATNSGYSDFFVAKISPAGTILWAVRGGAVIGNEIGFALALDAAGNVYVTGQFTGPNTEIGGTTLRNAVWDGSSEEIFVAKLSNAGQWLWAVRAGDTGGEAGEEIAVDAAGFAYITGHFTSAQLPIGPNTLTNAYTPQSTDVYVAKLDAAGNWLWAQRGGGTSGDVGRGIALDAGGNVYITGSFGGNRATFGSLTLTSTALSTAYVAKLDAQGNYLWARSSSGPGQRYDSGFAVAVDSRGDVYLTGVFENNGTTFGATSLSCAGSADIYVAKLDAAGNWLWAQRGGGSQMEFSTDLAVDGRGDVYLTGYFGGGPAVLGTTTLPFSGRDFKMLVAKLTTQGTWLWARAASGPENILGISLALDSRANVHVAGGYAGTSVTFGQLTLPGLANSSNDSGYLTRLAAAPTLQVAGDSLLCGTGQVRLTARASAGVVGYQWSTGATTSDITVAQPGTYSVTATFDGGSTQTTRFRVTSTTAPVVHISGDSLLCNGAPALLTAASPQAATYRWNTGATTASISVTQPGTYTITASYGSGCATTARYVVRAPALSLRSTGSLCVPGVAMRLLAVAPGATGFRWNTGALTPDITIGQPGTYTVTATFTGGCPLTASYTATRLDARIQGDTLLCPGQRVVLTAALPAGSPTPTGALWNTGATTPSITVTQPGTYSVELPFGPDGCAARATVRVRAALPAPPFSLGPDTVICENDELLLRAPALSLVGPVSYRWSDGSAGPTLRVQQAGQYTLSITTACATSTATRRVERRNCTIIPNVITPNHDQLNDVFAPRYLPPGPWTLEVYNRWGRAVFRSPDYRNTWGTEAAPGVYYYLLRQPGSGRSYKGWVEVVR